MRSNQNRDRPMMGLGTSPSGLWGPANCPGRTIGPLLRRSRTGTMARRGFMQGACCSAGHAWGPKPGMSVLVSRCTATGSVDVCSQGSSCLTQPLTSHGLCLRSPRACNTEWMPCASLVLAIASCPMLLPSHRLRGLECHEPHQWLYLIQEQLDACSLDPAPADTSLDLGRR